MAYSPPLATIVVSQPSSSPLFPGFGVKKVSENEAVTDIQSTLDTSNSRGLGKMCRVISSSM